MNRKTLIRLIATATLVAAGACGGGGASNSTTGLGNNGGATTNAIDVKDNLYSPATTTVATGTTVTWTWAGVNKHSVTFDDGATSPTQTAGTYDRTFTSPGTYKYHCLVHGNAMAGTVTVK